MIPSPAGCLATTDTSPDPETLYVMLVSRPLCEKIQISAVEAPIAGRTSGIGFPASVHELFAALNAPIAATFKSTSPFGCETPAVVGSTTTMSLSIAVGTFAVSGNESLDPSNARRTNEMAFDFVPSGFCTCTETLPADCVSVGVTGAVHSVAEMQVVVRAVPPIRTAEPDPFELATKPLPSTRKVNPFASPA